jgi:glycosyltransferase involved in cell wall biosynthesis
MSSHLRVTVVVPASAASGQIPNCLRSLFLQTFQNLEIIVVDGGLPDEARACVHECARLDPRIRLLPNEHGSAKMTGLRAAAGTHICFIDPDDWLSPTYIEELLQACRRHRVPAARCLYVSHCQQDETPRPDFPASVLTGARSVHRDTVVDSSDTLLWRPAIGTQLTERSFLLKHAVAFPENNPAFEDLAFHVQSAHHARRVALVAKRLYHGRKPHPDAANASNAEACQRADGFIAHFHVFRFLEKKLPTRFLDSPQYFLLKFQTHDQALAVIDKRLIAEYRTRAAFDLYFRLKARRAIHYIRVLYKLKSKYGRRALKLYTHYLTLKHNPPNMSPSGVTQQLVQ